MFTNTAQQQQHRQPHGRTQPAAPQPAAGGFGSPDPSPACGKYALHGAAVQLQCQVPMLAPHARRLLQSFAVSDWPPGFLPASGLVRPYEEEAVLRHLSPTAKRVARGPELIDLYEEGERFWLIDDRWGMAEMNLLKGHWRSWVLPQPRLDPVRCTEMAILWPLAQLLRTKGLYLIPATSVVRDGFAALILSGFGLEPELSSLVRAGYKIIGQRWTGVREEDGRLALLHVPGRLERPTCAGPRIASLRSLSGDDTDHCEGWVDLHDEHPGSWQNHAFCDAVLVAEPGRRPNAHLRLADPATALNVLKRAWPITELLPQRRYGQLPVKIAQHCRVGEVQLSRNPQDLLALLQSLRNAPASTNNPIAPAPMVAGGGSPGPGPGARPDRDDLSFTPWAGLDSPRSAAA